MACKIEKSEVLEALNSWEVTDDGRDAVKKEFKFEDFKDAYAFMTKIAEWYNVYNKVIITLTTHDVNGLSKKDISLGQFIDNQYEK